MADLIVVDRLCGHLAEGDVEVFAFLAGVSQGGGGRCSWNRMRLGGLPDREAVAAAVSRLSCVVLSCRQIGVETTVRTGTLLDTWSSSSDEFAWSMSPPAVAAFVEGGLSLSALWQLKETRSSNALRLYSILRPHPDAYELLLPIAVAMDVVLGGQGASYNAADFRRHGVEKALRIIKEIDPDMDVTVRMVRDLRVKGGKVTHMAFSLGNAAAVSNRLSDETIRRIADLIGFDEAEIPSYWQEMLDGAKEAAESGDTERKRFVEDAARDPNAAALAAFAAIQEEWTG